VKEEVFILSAGDGTANGYVELRFVVPTTCKLGVKFGNERRLVAVARSTVDRMSNTVERPGFDRFGPQEQNDLRAVHGIKVRCLVSLAKVLPFRGPSPERQGTCQKRIRRT
jgi:hypothetical protein